MKNVLIILDGKIAKNLVNRMIDLNNNLNHYDIIYTDKSVIPKDMPSNFIFYQFDPTSYSKLSFVLQKTMYQDALIVLNNKEDLLAVIKNIRIQYPILNFTIYNEWDLEIDDRNIQHYKGNDILTNGLIEQLPNIPVFAQNIGNRQGEIMEVKIPFGSSYAYRYIGSISQNNWHIAALYRNQELITFTASLVLKPNDVIVIIGKPDVLIQVYSAISKSQTQFPMPFGNNIYIYIDMFIQSEQEIVNVIEDAKILHQRMKNKKLILKITRPTTVVTLNNIKSKLENVQNLIIDMDYHNQGMKTILKEDKIKFDIGMIVLTKSIFNYKEAIKNIVDLKLPIFKIGSEHISSLKNTLVLLNDNKQYEQIAPMLFDISSQLKITPKVLNIDPIGDSNRDNLLSHFSNLSKIFNQNIIITSKKENPIRVIEKEQNILQILPLRDKMFEKRKIKFFSTNSDLLSFDMNKFNQILIPIIEELTE